MSELKTLKNIKELKGGKTILRAEAVKWVKWFRKTEKKNKIKIRADDGFCDFFNLTEEDMKEENKHENTN